MRKRPPIEPLTVQSTHHRWLSEYARQTGVVGPFPVIAEAIHRETDWARLRDRLVRRSERECCLVCGAIPETATLDMAHLPPYPIQPWTERVSRKLERTDVVLLCRTCHFALDKPDKWWDRNGSLVPPMQYASRGDMRKSIVSRLRAMIAGPGLWQ